MEPKTDSATAADAPRYGASARGSFMRRSASRFAVMLLAVALGLAGCASDNGGGPQMNKETVGHVLGGIGGAVLGSAFGSGSGRLVGVAADRKSTRLNSSH